MNSYGDLINSDKPVLINFYGDWSVDCQKIKEILKMVSYSLGDKSKVYRINVDENTELTKHLKIGSVPTYIIYQNGKTLWRDSGNYSANSIISIVNKYC